MILSCVNINTLQRTAFLVDKKNCFFVLKKQFFNSRFFNANRQKAFFSVFVSHNQSLPRLMIRPNRLIS